MFPYSFFCILAMAITSTAQIELTKNGHTVEFTGMNGPANGTWTIKNRTGGKVRDISVFIHHPTKDSTQLPKIMELDVSGPSLIGKIDDNDSGHMDGTESNTANDNHKDR